MIRSIDILLKTKLLDELAIGLKQILSILGDEAEGREGGFFRLFTINWFGVDGRVPVQHLATLVGRVPTNKLPLYEEISREKATRLIKNMRGHVSSWQSRDPASKRYGGAIRFTFPPSEKVDGEPRFAIFTFSGLPEEADEAFMIWLACKTGWLGREEADVIIFLSKNELATEMLNAG